MKFIIASVSKRSAYDYRLAYLKIFFAARETILYQLYNEAVEACINEHYAGTDERGLLLELEDKYCNEDLYPAEKVRVFNRCQRRRHLEELVKNKIFEV